MGDGRDKQHDTSVATDIVTGTFSPSAVVGKRTLTGDVDSPSGDQFIDHGAACKNSVRQDCFLTTEQRANLINDYKMRVVMALDAYQRALGAIRVDRLLEKGDSDLGWIATLLLDVVGLHAVSMLVSAVQTLRAAQLADLGRAVALDPDAARNSTAVASTMYIALSSTTNERLAALSKTVFDEGKRKAINGLKKQLQLEKDDKKAANLSYIARLEAAATAAFEDLRLKPPGMASDAQLLVLWSGFDPNNHTSDIYKTELEAKIARYETSGVKDVGRGVGYVPPPSSGDSALDSARIGTGAFWERDTVVVRVRFLSGYPDKFAYAARDWCDAMLAEGLTPMDLPSHQNDEPLPIDQDRWKGRDIPLEARRTVQPDFLRFIDDEFVGVALERHIAVYGKPPDTIEADDSSWAWDKERSRKARENKTRKGAFGIPRLDLRDVPSSSQGPIAIPDELVLKNTP